MNRQRNNSITPTSDKGGQSIKGRSSQAFAGLSHIEGNSSLENIAEMKTINELIDLVSEVNKEAARIASAHSGVVLHVTFGWRTNQVFMREFELSPQGVVLENSKASYEAAIFNLNRESEIDAAYKYIKRNLN